MATEQKLDFLHEWCDNLSRALQGAQASIQNLHERLRVAEGKAGGKA